MKIKTYLLQNKNVSELILICSYFSLIHIYPTPHSIIKNIIVGPTFFCHESGRCSGISFDKGGSHT